MVKDHVVRVRVSSQEYNHLVAESALCGISTSEYIRRKCLGHKTVARLPIMDDKAITMLKRISGLIKAIYMYKFAPDNVVSMFKNEIDELKSYIRGNHDDN